ncbi:MAG: cohesin domain-containing protein [Candidatus Promineifilaceae bacterium]
MYKLPAQAERYTILLLTSFGALLGWAAMVMATAQAAGHLSPAAETASLSVSPPAASILVSDTLTVNIVVSDVVDLYGAELALAFDPAIVAVVDDNPGLAGVQITPGSCPEANFVAQNTADNGAGTIHYAVTSLAPAAPCSGTGIIASVTFQGLAPGTSLISFTTWLLSDSDIQPIATTVTSGSLAVELRPGTIQGGISLQGRSNHSGVLVAIWDSAGWPASWLTSTVTGVAGDYYLSVPAGSYTVTVEMNGYLDALRSAVTVDPEGQVDLPQLALPCGDPNNDDLINIQDLTILGSRYRLSCGDAGWDDRADMINDCVVNILDLTCSGVNYGRSSPVAWP